MAPYGGPGVGKARLCYEVTRAEEARGFRVLEVPAVSYGRGTPYSAIATLLRHYFGITETQSTAEPLRRLQLGRAPVAPPQAECLALRQGLLHCPGDNRLRHWLGPRRTAPR